MLVDIVLPGWVPFYGINLSEDVPGYIAAPATAPEYPWTCSRPPPPSRSWSRSASTSATAWTSTREQAPATPRAIKFELSSQNLARDRPLA
jgi:hypothetical protein